jgi:hypothetical protein
MALEGVHSTLESAAEFFLSYGLIPGEALRNIGKVLDRPAAIFNTAKATLALTLAALLTACGSGVPFDYVSTEEDYQDPNRVARMLGEYDAQQMAQDQQAGIFSNETTADGAGPEISEQREQIRRPITVQSTDDGVFEALQREGFSVDQMRILVVIVYHGGEARAYDFNNLLVQNPRIDEGDDLLALSHFDNAEFRLPAENLYIG